MAELPHSKRTRVAIIGSGISGLTCAYLLSRYSGKGNNSNYDFTLFESADRLGGHTSTVDVVLGGKTYAIDSGFIVYNDWTYPNFIRLLDELKVNSQATDMSFSVSCSASRLEYSGSDFNTLFAQRKNLLNFQFWLMLSSILRFNRKALQDLQLGVIDEVITLGQYLEKNKFSGLFVSHYLIPMCAAIWSASFNTIANFPLLFFVNFFKNHGLLSISERPQWRVICGGSKQYIEPLVAPIKAQIKLNCAVKSVKRCREQVKLLLANDSVERFDQVIFACHSDQALKLLDDTTPMERQCLSAIPYQDNEVVLHTDTGMLPHNRRAWAAWNYQLVPGLEQKALLTYNMNILQNIKSDITFCVSLNPSLMEQTKAIDKSKVIANFHYSHPVFSQQSINAQAQWEAIAGHNRTSFCGAYWGNGFHEDGVKSAIRVCEGLGVRW